MEVTTEEIHRHVWSATLARAADNIGVTVSILRTLCANYSISRPTVADWAKVRSGAVSSITELAPAFAGQSHTISLLDPDVATNLSASERRRIEELPKRLHSAVGGVTAVRDGWGPAAIDNPAISDVRATSKVVARRDRLASSLAYACERVGGRVRAEDGLYRVDFGDGHVLYRVTERLRKVQLPITDLDRKWKTANFHRGWRAGLEPTGKLVCEVDTYCSGFKRVWEDQANRVVEDQLEAIVATLRAMCQAMAEAKRIRKERDERLRVADELRMQDRARQQVESERWSRLKRAAESWNEHQLLSELLKKLQSMPLAPDEIIEDRKASEWVDWLASKLAEGPFGGTANQLLRSVISGHD